MYVVTGGAGFIGSQLVAALSARPENRVVVCDRFSTDDRWKNVARSPVEEFVAPSQLFDFLSTRGREVTAILHMGAISATTERDVDAIIDQNIQTTRRLWDWCTKHDVRFIYASSAATYGDGEQGFRDDDSLEYLSGLEPLNAYGWSKHHIDRWVARSIARGEQTPPQWAALKFFNVYGANEYHKGSMQSVVAKSFPVAARDEVVSLFRSHRAGYSDGGQLRDFVYVKDCVRVIEWLLEQPKVSGLFNIGTGQARSFEDLASAVFAALGKEPRIRFIDMPEEIREKYQYFTQADMTKLRSAGYRAPFHSLEEGIRDYVQNYLATDRPYEGAERIIERSKPARRAG